SHRDDRLRDRVEQERSEHDAVRAESGDTDPERQGLREGRDPTVESEQVIEERLARRELRDLSAAELDEEDAETGRRRRARADDAKLPRQLGETDLLEDARRRGRQVDPEERRIGALEAGVQAPG